MKQKINNKPEMDLTRALSWSGYSCFADPQWGNPEKWYERYVLGIKEKPTRQLLFGSKIDKQIQNDPEFLPELERYPVQQYKLEAVYKGIPLLGFADQWDPYSDVKRLADDKTGVNPWTQKKANETGQLTMYSAMLWLTEGIKPEDIEFAIRWLPTVQNADLSIMFAKPFAIQTFKTKRRLADVVKFLDELEKTWIAMQKYCEDHE